VLKRQHCVAFVVISEAVPAAGRFHSAAGGCAAQQITRRVLLSHAILAADYEQPMADGQTFSVL
jgi:hypothetical protein